MGINVPYVNPLLKYSQRSVSIAPLIVFRLIFGALMAWSAARFLWNGWVHELYGKPGFFFSYYGFHWLPRLSETYIVLIYFVMLFAYISVALGWKYKWSATIAFLCFTYTELIDVTTYLNHYYFCSLISFLMIFLPAGNRFSLDTYFSPHKTITHIPFWMIGILQLQLAIVYFYAGLAKLNSDWLWDAMPLRLWLTARNDMPLIGSFLDDLWVAYAFSWAGALYDLCIPFLLWSSRFRLSAYGAVILFHVLTRILFPIGMFPFIMIASTLLFFSVSFHERLLHFLQRMTGSMQDAISIKEWERPPKQWYTFLSVLLGLYIVFQLLFPFRYICYPGKLFWTEQGYRFSWRVMLMEKAGVCFFFVKNPETGQKTEVIVGEHLTPLQEKMMSTQPDLILQFAHYLDRYYRQLGVPDPEIYVDARVALNGQRSKPFIDPSIDLSTIHDSWAHKSWIIPY